jgi:hypothetical protein
MPVLLLFLLGILVTIEGCSHKIVEDTTEVRISPVKAEASPRQKHFAKHFKQTLWRGFNALQTSRVAWTSPHAKQSLENMKATGANSVVLITFLKQPGPHSTDIWAANNVTDKQLIAAIETAHQLGLMVIIKPQVLVENSWAGEISFKDESRMNRWFRNYSALILRFAKLSQRMGVEAFVMGTELSKIAKHLPWLELIAQLRKVFKGKLTYAAHNLVGVDHFPYWYKLDAIGVSLYPSLGDFGEYDEMLAHVEHSMYKLNNIVKQQLNKTVWLLEIGMPSADGFSAQPWAWKSEYRNKFRANMNLQTGAIAAWLSATNRMQNVDGIFFWNWYSDPLAGGEKDTDYTVQNKPAEILIRQYWKY